jgi:hypothetical protein
MRNYKKNLTGTNALFAVNFDMKITFAVFGADGTSSDSAILRYVNQDLKLPEYPLDPEGGFLQMYLNNNSLFI